MPDVSTCPELHGLMRMVLGTASPGEVRALSEHLLHCKACLDTLHGLKTEASLINHLQAHAAAGDQSVKQLMDSVIRKLQDSARRSPPSSVHEQTMAYDSVKESDLIAPSGRIDADMGRLGGYEIKRLLGSGGMGFVFHAHDVHLQRAVALKVMRPETARDKGSRERFLREARAAAALKHDHIVTIYQVGQENDTPFLAMEFLEGESLESRLEREGKLPIPEVLRITREIAEGLAAAHNRGMIHRDIKPANIWLEAITGRVKILDFGLVRPATGDVHLTGSGMILGTPQYMAPEQARGDSIDARADLFSLGCVMYRMCSGSQAFQGDSLMAVLTALAVSTPPPLSEVDRNIPAGLVDLVSSLLAKDPRDRPPTAQAVVEAVAALEQGLTPTLTELRKSRTLVRPARHASVQPPSSLYWRAALVGAGAMLTVALATFLVWWNWEKSSANSHAVESTSPAVAAPTGPPIRVGVLHSRSGTMAISVKPVIDATLLAIEELNEKGGVLGRPVEPIIEDGRSDWDLFAQKAEKLIAQDQAAVIFGCWTSASRKAVKPVVEKHNHLLFYPLQYEGLEHSPNIVYVGAAPNQQLIPAVKWCCSYLQKKRLFFVGSDYVFPRAASAIIHDQVKELGGEMVGESYLLLGSIDTRETIARIHDAKPDLILNAINGDSNVAFFRALRGANHASNRTPVLSFSITEEELGSLSIKDVEGDYAAWTYFQNIDRPQNHEFVRRFRQRYGPERVLTDPMEAAYTSVHLWAQAVKAAGKLDPPAVRDALKGMTFEAPQGTIQVDPETLHCSKYTRIGQVRKDGTFEVVYSSDEPIEPIPYPATRSRAEWHNLLNDLHLRWGGHWANPKTD